jgi:hypothetical protein
MERIAVTPQTDTAISDFKASHGAFDEEVYKGSNLVPDDHLQIDTSWQGVVLGGEGGLVWFCIPDWGDIIMPIDLVNYVTDRAGPNGETMPIFDPPDEEEETVGGEGGTP